MTYVVLDSFPNLVVARRVGIADVSAVRTMLARVDGLIFDSQQRSARSALVYDAGTKTGGEPDAQARRVGGEWFKRRRRELLQGCAGFDFAFPSSLSRGALTAVFWIASPPVPYAIHEASLAAIQSAIARLGPETRIEAASVLAALDQLAARR